LTSKKDAQTKGRIIAHHGLKVLIDIGSEIVDWKPPRRETWVVGDIVHFKEGRPFTEKRRNALKRAGYKGAEQILAANLDQLIITASCGEAFRLGLIDRFIVVANHEGIEPVIVLNKTDLADSEEKIKIVERYARLGYGVFYLSAKTGEGLNALAGSLNGKIASMVGHSGVGKTSIINMLAPGLERATAKIHEKTGQGRHTTSSAMLVKLPTGGEIIDSPGIRHFIPSGLTPADIAENFPGFNQLQGQCKFRDCKHLTEPKCAILTAVEENELNRDLYDSYKRLLESLEDN